MQTDKRGGKYPLSLFVFLPLKRNLFVSITPRFWKIKKVMLFTVYFTVGICKAQETTRFHSLIVEAKEQYVLFYDVGAF